jgi:ribosomal protein L11
MVDMNASSIESAVRSLSGTARSIGISVVNWLYLWKKYRKD